MSLSCLDIVDRLEKSCQETEGDLGIKKPERLGGVSGFTPGLRWTVLLPFGLLHERLVHWFGVIGFFFQA